MCIEAPTFRCGVRNSHCKHANRVVDFVTLNLTLWPQMTEPVVRHSVHKHSLFFKQPIICLLAGICARICERVSKCYQESVFWGSVYKIRSCLMNNSYNCYYQAQTFKALNYNIKRTTAFAFTWGFGSAGCNFQVHKLRFPRFDFIFFA